MRNWTLTFAGTLAVLVLAVACSNAAEEPKEGLEVGDKFLHYDTFSAKTIDGDEIKLADYKGKVLFIDFWAAWCAPCRGELPYLKVVEDTYVGDDFAILGISLDQKIDDLRKMATEMGIKYPHICDEKGWQSGYAKTYGIRSIPTNFLLDRNGVIIAKNVRNLAARGHVAKALGQDDPATFYADAVDAVASPENADVDKALEVLAKAIEADPERPEYRFLAAMLIMNTLREDEAIEHFRIGLDHRDKLHTFDQAMMAYARLSYLYKKNGQTDKAVSVLDEAIEAINALPDVEKNNYVRAIPQIRRLKEDWTAEAQAGEQEEEPEQEQEPEE